METREKRMRGVEDAEKRRQFRIAHGLEEPSEQDLAKEAKQGEQVDDQSPIAPEARDGAVAGEYVDWEGKRRPIKKWLGIW
jgi:hypothetical protein